MSPVACWTSGWRFVNPGLESAMRRFVIASIALLLLTPSPASANMLDMFGTSSRSQGMGSVGVASATDFSVLYYNPARMVLLRNSVSLEIQHGYSDVGILLAPRPAGYDPDTYEHRNPRSDTTGMSSMWGVTMGGVFDFGTDVVSAGFLVFLPASGVGNQESHFVQETEQYFSNKLHFDLVGERLQTQSILAGLSLRATDWLQVGLGAAFTLASYTDNDIFTPNPTSPGKVDINVSIEQDSRVALITGLNFELGNGVSAGLALRDEQSFELVGSNHVTLHGMEGTDNAVLEQPLDLFLHFAPRTYTGGASWRNKRLQVALDGAYLEWSRYKDNHGNKAGFDDTLEIGVGAELDLDRLKVRLGSRYAQSPVPEQTGRTNFVGNDRYLISSGLGGKFDVFGTNIGIDLHLQVHLMPEHKNTKAALDSYEPCTSSTGAICDEDVDMPGLQTGNPGFPGYSSGGFIMAGGITVTWEFGREKGTARGDSPHKPGGKR